MTYRKEIEERINRLTHLIRSADEDVCVDMLLEERHDLECYLLDILREQEAQE
jgi:hypothetical protein